jgi:hypothetical protein
MKNKEKERRKEERLFKKESQIGVTTWYHCAELTNQEALFSR